jgi:hypothetical protein
MAKNNKSQNTNKPVDGVVNTTPDAAEVISPVETPVATDEAPVVNPDDKSNEAPVTDGTETPEQPVATDEAPVVNPDVKAADTPVVNPDDKPADTPVTDGADTPVVNPDDAAKSEDTDAEKDKVETKLNLFRRFDIRYASSVDKGVYVTRKNWSTSDLVNTFVKMPTSFIAFETKEDLEEFKKIIAVKEINVLDKDGKKVPFSKPAKEHLVSRLSELSDMWISKKLK